MREETEGGMYRSYAEFILLRQQAVQEYKECVGSSNSSWKYSTLAANILVVVIIAAPAVVVASAAVR